MSGPNFSRRQFMAESLKWGLVFPFLPPFLSKATAAATPPLRFIQILVTGGMLPEDFWPQVVPAAVVGNNIHSMKLTDIPADKLPVLVKPFADVGVLSKMSYIRGTGMTTNNYDPHNSWYATTNAGGVTNSAGDVVAEFPYSVDQVLARNIYSSEPVVRSLVSCPVKSLNGVQGYHRLAAWWGPNNSVGYQDRTNTVISTLFGNVSTSPMQDTSVQAALLRKQKIVDIQRESFKRMIASPSLRTEDRHRLSNFADLLNELKLKFEVRSPTSCQAVSANTENNDGDVIRNQARAIAAAFACDTTRVVSWTVPHGYDPVHEYQHSASPEAGDGYVRARAGHSGLNKPFYEALAFLLKTLDDVKEADGSSVLDNCVILFGNEHGTGRMAHDVHDMGTIIAGGARGLLRMGEYIDYRTDQKEHFWYDAYDTPGRPYGNVLVSIFNAMGLPSAKYEQGGVAGLGSYDQPIRNASGSIPKRDLSFYCTPAERRKPLEYFYTGPARG